MAQRQERSDGPTVERSGAWASLQNQRLAGTDHRPKGRSGAWTSNNSFIVNTWQHGRLENPPIVQSDKNPSAPL